MHLSKNRTMLTDKLKRQPQDQLTLDGRQLSIGDVVSAGKNRFGIGLTDDPEVLNRVAASVKFVRRAVTDGEQIYGVTTGFGGMADKPVPAELAAASQNNLLSFLATGAGRAIDLRHVRGAMLLRANVLLRGCSGVRLEIIERIIQFLQADAIPVVRELGSIGASGDLVPLATIARAITGQTGFVKIRHRDQTIDSSMALDRLGLERLELLPKEGLAIVNGTSFSSAIAANAVHESQNLMALAIGAQAMIMRALLVNENPFEAFVHQCKPHPGQIWTADITRRLLAEGRTQSNGKSVYVQDRYSLRCLPQYMGPIVEGMAQINRTVETEMNSISDNPLIDPETGTFYQSGNFLGQYVGIAMDDLRRNIGLMAKHLDVQIANLVTPEFSGGLTSSLRGNAELSYNMGLKGLQITGNSIMPLLTYHGNPLVDHFPTHAEQFNQNVNGLSWGAANLAWNSVELFHHYMSVALIFAVQSLDMRAKSSFGHYDGRVMLGTLAEPLYSAVYRVLDCDPGKSRPFLFDDSDRWLESDLEKLRDEICNEGSVVDAVKPILDSFRENFLEQPLSEQRP
jgi:phenylalanine ammonia-lyase